MDLGANDDNNNNNNIMYGLAPTTTTGDSIARFTLFMNLLVAGR